MRITYEKKYVAYLDVLGFKGLVREKSKIADYFNIVETKLEELSRIKQPLERLLISDSIILTYPLGIENLRELCIAIGKLQYELCFNGIWLRGAVTEGEISINHEKRLAVGTGLIEAYELERKASTPRVILDVTLLSHLSMGRQEFIAQMNKSGTWEGRAVFEMMGFNVYGKFTGDLVSVMPDLISLRDELFVDYLSPILRADEEVKDRLYQLLKDTLYSKQEHYSKYRWVVSYLKCLSFGNFMHKQDTFYQKLESL